MTRDLPNETRSFDLGRWLGRREAFSTVAGRCSAADVEALKRIRDKKLYKDRARNWGDFCERFVGSRSQVNRMIGYLEEFGPAYFQVSQFSRISPESYRAIASHVSENGLDDGREVIALLPENSEKVNAAIARLRKEAKVPAVPDEHTLDRLRRRCEDVQTILDHMNESSRRHRICAAEMLAGVWQAAARIGIDLSYDRR